MPTPPRQLNVEEYMVQAYREMEPRMRAYSDRDVLVAILRLPPYPQRRLWQAAAARVAHQVRTEASLCFVSFHASFYHQRKTELVSPVDLPSLRRMGGKARMLVMLIDDCYDVYRRLLGEAEMFHDEVMGADVDAQDAMVHSFCNLFTILAWRESEAMASRLIADALRIPLIMLAVKHPASLAQRLITTPQDSLRLFYVAHPISQVRRGRHARPSGLPGQLSAFVERTMTQYEDIALFIPDTIDEARIGRDEEGRLIPQLDEPWSLPFRQEDWLFEPLPPGLAHLNPLNPKGFRFSTSRAARSQLSAMLSVLSQKVRAQIVARDHSLVEQALDGIILFHPYYEGHVPGGVLREARYNYELITAFGQRRRKAYMLDYQENLGKYRIQNLWDVFLNTALDQSSVAPDVQAAVDNLVLQWKRDPARVRAFVAADWPLEDVRTAAREMLGDGYRFDEQFAPTDTSSLRGPNLGEAADRLQRSWNAIEQAARTSDPFRALCPEPDKQCVLVPVHDFDHAAVAALASS
ncbi:MAG: hypothetical protein Q8Q12_10310 [bacterium]|nr:hypothetical protein [bacterium]